MEAMASGKGGGAVDALLVEYDERTGEAMPCLTHEGLASFVRATVGGWSSDKSHGATANAYTATVADALFAVEADMRGACGAPRCATRRRCAPRWNYTRRQLLGKLEAVELALLVEPVPVRHS